MSNKFSPISAIKELQSNLSISSSFDWSFFSHFFLLLHLEMPTAVLCMQHQGLLVYDGNMMMVLLGLSQYYLWSPYRAVD